MNKNKNNLTFGQRIRQYQPTTRLVKILLVWWIAVVIVTAIKLTDGFGVSELEELINLGMIFCQLILAIIVIVCLIDVLRLIVISDVNRYRLQREYPSNVAIFHPLDIKVLLSFIPNTESGSSDGLLTRFLPKSIHLEFCDEYPAQLQLTQGMPIDIRIDLNETAPIFDDKGEEITQAYSKKIVYPTQPTERGTGYFGLGQLRVISPLSLFRRKITIIQSQDKTHTNHYLRVLADFTGLLTNELSAVFEKSFDAGIQTIKEQGQGSEFLKLREYAVGDSMRQIDWKASSRQGRIMSKSYEDENDQDVVFLLDCSEQMRHRASSENLNDAINHTKLNTELSYFDKVLNAVLLLSYVANKQGDKVGLMTFGGANGGEEKFIVPTKGVSLIRHLLNETADIMPSMDSSDYFKASQSLKKSINKRSLVILITNTRQEASDELMQAMKMLSRQHQLVFANLTEQAVQDIVEHKIVPMSMDEALLYHSLTSYQYTRNKLHERLRQQTGAMCLSTTANKLPIVLTQAYLSARNK